MANRVVLGKLPTGEMGLRVSRPGSNVLDMGLPPKQVAFDSRWSRGLRVWMTGVASTPPAAGQVTTINYGRTCTDLPIVILVRNHQFIAGRYDQVSTELKVFRDRFEFRLVGGFSFTYYVIVP